MIAKIRHGRIVEVCNNIFTSSTEIRDGDYFEDLDELPGGDAEEVEEILDEAPVQPIQAKKAGSCKHIADAMNGK